MRRHKRRLGVALLSASMLLFVLAGIMAGTASAATQEPHKAFVCKYVGTPGDDERLQTGQNPIDVDFNAIDEDPVTVGSYFTDAQGRSFVLAIDTGQDEPDVSDCPGFVPVTTTTTSQEDTSSTSTTSTTSTLPDLTTTTVAGPTTSTTTGSPVSTSTSFGSPSGPSNGALPPSSFSGQPASSTLAFTGAGSWWTAFAGLVLLCVGGGIVLSQRRKHGTLTYN